jgi:hypothetical protein
MGPAVTRRRQPEVADQRCCIAEGLDPALAVLEGWQLLRGAP